MGLGVRDITRGGSCILSKDSCSESHHNRDGVLLRSKDLHDSNSERHSSLARNFQPPISRSPTEVTNQKNSLVRLAIQVMFRNVIGAPLVAKALSADYVEDARLPCFGLSVRS